MSQLSMCRSYVTLERQTVTKDAAGGMPRSWATVTADTPADIQPASARVMLAWMQQQLRVSHTIYLSADVQAKKTDRFTTSDGRIFLIHGYRRSAPGYTSWPAVADVEEVITS
jgi:head-tail adaptor